MKLTLHYAALTDPGCVRGTNEDHWTADPEQGLFIVADGMGGECAGALASKTVVETLPGLVRQSFAGMNGFPRHGAGRRLAKAIVTLSTQLREQTRNEPGLAGLGSTVVCALVRDAQAVIAYMGDSRAYRLRQGRLKQLTKDHTLVQLLLDYSEITPAEALTHPARGQLTRHVGMEGEPLPEARLIRLMPRDTLLLCTDGLTGMVSDERIRSILNDSAPLHTQCQCLVKAANETGGKDNITVLLLSFEEGPRHGRQTTRDTARRTRNRTAALKRLRVLHGSTSPAPR